MREKLKLTQAIEKAKSLAEVITAILGNIKGVVNCSSCAFFSFKPNLFSEDDHKHIFIQKTVVESRYLDVVSLKDADLQTAAFSSTKDAEN